MLKDVHFIALIIREEGTMLAPEFIKPPFYEKPNKPSKSYWLA